MTYHILFYSADHDPRVPPFLKGQLVPVKLDHRYTDHCERLDEYWNEAESRYVFDTPLWFVSRERWIDLDYYPVFDGFLASDRLMECLHRHVPDGLLCYPVDMVHESGKENSARRMSFCQMRDRRAACDLERMDIGGVFHPELAGPNEVQTLAGRMVVARALDLVLRPDLPPWFGATDIFACWCLLQDQVRDDLEKSGFIGVRTIDTRDVAIVDFMPGPGGYSVHTPQWRQRSDLELWQEQLGPPIRSQFFDPAKVMDDPEIAALIANMKMTGIK